MSTHDYFLRSDTKSRVLRRVDEMVAMYGGPEKVIKKPSATRVGVHIIFREDAEEPSTSRPRPLPLPLSHSSIASNMDHAEPHVPRPQNARTPALDEPRACRRAGNSQPTGWNDGNAPSGVSVDGNDAALEALEAARQRVAQQ
jgi:hypothetical protein